MAAGQYQAIVRPLTGITYLYLPIIALIQAAQNATAQKRVKLLMVAGVALGGLGSVGIGVFLIVFGRDLWPDFRFDTKVVVAAAVAATAMCVATVIGIQLMLRGKQLIISVNTSTGAALLLVLSLLTVERMGALGAGLASASPGLSLRCVTVSCIFTQCRRIGASDGK